MSTIAPESLDQDATPVPRTEPPERPKQTKMVAFVFLAGLLAAIAAAVVTYLVIAPSSESNAEVAPVQNTITSTSLATTTTVDPQIPRQQDYFAIWVGPAEKENSYFVNWGDGWTLEQAKQFANEMAPVWDAAIATMRNHPGGWGEAQDEVDADLLVRGADISRLRAFAANPTYSGWEQYRALHSTVGDADNAIRQALGLPTAGAQTPGEVTRPTTTATPPPETTLPGEEYPGQFEEQEGEALSDLCYWGPTAAQDPQDYYDNCT